MHRKNRHLYNLHKEKYETLNLIQSRRAGEYILQNSYFRKLKSFNRLMSAN